MRGGWVALALVGSVACAAPAAPAPPVVAPTLRSDTPVAVVEPEPETPAPESTVETGPPPIELRVVKTNRVEYERSGYAAVHPVGAAAGAKPWLEIQEELGPCEELWTSVDSIPFAQHLPYVMAQLICDNGNDYASRELRTMLVRYDLEAQTAELLWSGGGSSTNEMDACVSYEVHAFVRSDDGTHIKVLHQSEVIRGEEAAEFGLECTAEAFRSDVVDRVELGP